MVDNNDSLLREVEDELRNDKIKKLWNDFGTYVIGAVIAFIASIFIYQQVQQSRIAAAEAAGARYEAARRLAVEGKGSDATAAFAAIAADGTAGYGALARLQTAAANVKADKSPEAVAAYDAIANDTTADDVLRDLARLQAAALRLGAGDFTELQNRLTPLVDERNAFRALARELMGLSARAAGKSEDARRYFLQVIGDAKASQALKDRVSGYLSALVTADLGKTAATPADTGKPAEAGK
jgi:hypothetical protein